MARVVMYYGTYDTHRYEMTFRRMFEFTNVEPNFAGIVVPRDIIDVILRKMIDLRLDILPLYNNYEHFHIVKCFKGHAKECVINMGLQFSGFRLSQFKMPVDIKRRYDNSLWKPSYRCHGVNYMHRIEIRIFFGFIISKTNLATLLDRDYVVIKENERYFCGKCIERICLGQENIYEAITRKRESPAENVLDVVKRYGKKIGFEIKCDQGVFYVQ